MKARGLLAGVLAPFLLVACGLRVADKMVVQITYQGTLADGTVFDASAEGQPTEFMFGVGMMFPALEEGIRGLRAGDKKRIEVKAADAYGERQEAAVQEVPRDRLPEEMDLEVGVALTAQTPEGPIYATVTELREETVILDFNHPLAGKDLAYDVAVVGVRRPTVEELDGIAAGS
jgi:peptidylprolyl isomerase